MKDLEVFKQYIDVVQQQSKLAEEKKLLESQIPKPGYIQKLKIPTFSTITTITQVLTVPMAHFGSEIPVEVFIVATDQGTFPVYRYFYERQYVIEKPSMSLDNLSTFYSYIKDMMDQVPSLLLLSNSPADELEKINIGRSYLQANIK